MRLRRFAGCALAGGFSLLLIKPGGGIDLQVYKWRGGFALSGAGAAVVGFRVDQAFDSDDHGKSLDLGGHAVSSHFGTQVGDFPKPSEDSPAAQVLASRFFSFLLHEALLH